MEVVTQIENNELKKHNKYGNVNFCNFDLAVILTSLKLCQELRRQYQKLRTTQMFID